MSEWLDFFGHFHPLVLHLPIGFFLLALLMEWRGGFRADAAWAGPARFALGWAAFTALLAAGTGWLLASADYPHDTLERHRWLGVATALGLVAVWLIRVQGASRLARLASSALTLAVLTLAAHQGGNLSHGEGFLSEALPSALRREPRPTAAAVIPDTVFATLVEPSLAHSCVKCHGPQKTKGNVRVDSHARLLASKKGEAVVPGKPESSRLLQVAQLPRDDEDAMPPNGKSDALTADQIAVIRWWIAQGAREDTPMGALPAELKPQADAVRALLGNVSALPAAAASAPGVPAYVPKLVASLSASGLLIQPLSQRDTLLTVECVNLGSQFDGAYLRRLLPLAPYIAWLDASRTGLSTGSLASLTRYAKLTRLQLNGTTIGDVDLQALARLPKLESLNLTGTPVTDAGLERLAGPSALKRLYVWDTQVTTQGLARLRAARPELEVDAGGPSAQRAIKLLP